MQSAPVEIALQIYSATGVPKSEIRGISLFSGSYVGFLNFYASKFVWIFYVTYIFAGRYGRIYPLFFALSEYNTA